MKIVIEYKDKTKVVASVVLAAIDGDSIQITLDTPYEKVVDIPLNDLSIVTLDGVEIINKVEEAKGNLIFHFRDGRKDYHHVSSAEVKHGAIHYRTENPCQGYISHNYNVAYVVYNGKVIFGKMPV